MNLTPTLPIVKLKRMDPYADLPPARRKKAIQLIKLAKLQGKIPRSIQQRIPYVQMLRSGLCQSGERSWNKTLEFFDMNYKLAKPEDKAIIFDSWCKFLNSFDSSMSVQFSFVNEKIDTEQFYAAVELENRGDELDELRDEYVTIQKDRLAKGNNGLRKRKFLTFGIDEDNAELAEQKLDRIEQELMTSLKLMGVRSEPQNGYQRMEVMHDLMNIGTDRKLNFNWSLIAKTGLTTKDFISPFSMDFTQRRTFGLENFKGRAASLLITAAEMSDEVLSDFLDIDSPMVATLHIQSVDHTEALKMAKNQLTDLNAMKVQENMKASRQGYSTDILPVDLITYIDEAEEMVENLQSRNERMFMVTVLFTFLAEDDAELEIRFSTAKNLAQKYSCEMMPLDWRQEAGLMSSLPVGADLIRTQRPLTTSSAAVFVPFQTQELFMPGGICYGVNGISHNLVLIDRKAVRNPNGLILGTPGSGKSVAAKNEIVAVILTSDDDVLMIDPEREYTSLVNAFGGQVIRISADSRQHINPMDINLDVANDEDADYDPIASKSDFIVSFCEQVLGGRGGLEPLEMSVIDRCVLQIYERFMKDPRKENMPILRDLYELLQQQSEPEAKRIATGLERYVTGSLNVFNYRTNVDITNRLVCFDTKDLGQQLKKLGMLVTQDQVWNRVTVNRARGKSTRYYVDEFHLLLKDEQTAAAAVEMWKRFRKWGGAPTGITQNVKDFLSSKEIENIFENSDFVMLLNQSPGDQQILAQALRISEHQMTYVTNSRPGEGLIIFNGTIIPFNNQIPTDTRLYKLMSTRFGEGA